MSSKLFAQFFPLVLAAVVAVERTVGAGNGAGKKTLVLAGVQAAAKVAESAENKTVAAVGNLIDAVVGSLNETGILDGWPAKEEVKK